MHAGLPAAPAGTLVQVPTEPARLQALQLPTHAVLQQALSTQLALAHSFKPAQPTPRAFFGTQAVPLQ